MLTVDDSLHNEAKNVVFTQRSATPFVLVLFLGLSACAASLNEDSMTRTVKGSVTDSHIDVSGEYDSAADLERSPCSSSIPGLGPETVVTVKDEKGQTVVRTSLSSGKPENVSFHGQQELDDLGIGDSEIAGTPKFADCVFYVDFEVPEAADFISVTVGRFGEVALDSDDLSKGMFSLNVSE